MKLNFQLPWSNRCYNVLSVVEMNKHVGLPTCWSSKESPSDIQGQQNWCKCFSLLFSACILSSLAERLKGKTQPWVGEVIRSRSLTTCKCPCIFCCRCIATRHSNTGLHLASPSSMVKVPTAIHPPTYVEMCFHHVRWVPWLPFPKEMHSQSYGTWVFTRLMVSTVTYS